MARQRLLVYGDQTDDTLSAIKNIYRQAKSSVNLAEYLTRCTDALQVEVAKLCHEERKHLPHFHSILDLAEKHDGTNESGLLVLFILSYLARIGELIISAENDPTLLTSRYNVIGLGAAGLIPATIGAAARGVPELVELGIAFVPLCLRVAVANAERSRQLTKLAGCWGYTIRGLLCEDLQKILDDFHKANAIPIHQQVYISIGGLEWCAIMGPPASLSCLFAWSEALRGQPRTAMSAIGLVHASHLPPMNMDAILGSSALLEKPFTIERVSIMSTSKCEPYSGTSIGAVFREVLTDGLERPLRLADTIAVTVGRMAGNGDVDITCIGPSQQTQSIESALQLAEMEYTIRIDARTPSCGWLRGGSNKIAIVGMAGRFPLSDDIKAFWQVMLAGVDCHTLIPPDRFPIDDFFDPNGEKKNSTSTKHGCFLNNPGAFDPRLFNVSPREAKQMDPVQRLLLLTSHEALENAGYSPNATPSTDTRRTSVFIGQCTDPWRDISAGRGVDVCSLTGLLRIFAPGKLSNHFKFEGPAYSLDAACASSSTAVALACSALVGRECDMALAGGAQLANTPLEFAGLNKAGFLSTTGGCKTFRLDADGYCRGEGVGVVVLKRLEDALAENDNIHSVICGWGRNHSADAFSITHPHAETQARLYRRVLQQACLEPQDITYVEMHGTGTQAGDSVEMDSVTSVFAQDRLVDNPLFVGSLKASVGHSEAASGITAVLKTSLMLREGIILPQVGLPSKLNPAFPKLEELNVRIAMEMTALRPPPDGDGKKRILVNNFDAAGGNTCLILEEGPATQEKTSDPRSWHVVVVGARTASALRGNKKRLLDYLITHPHIKLADLAYSTTTRRMHHVLRSAYTGSSTGNIIRQLERDMGKPDETAQTFQGNSTVVFVFTGQGSQYPGMGHELYRTNKRFRSRVESLQNTATFLGLPYFADIIESPVVDIDKKSTTQVQLAIVCLELALGELWISWGVRPSVVLGHSLGEYAALCVAGVLSSTDTLFLVGKRAALVEKSLVTGEYGMLSTAATADEIQTALHASGFSASCQIVCYNAPESNVVSGKVDKLKGLEDYLNQKDIQSRSLDVPYGFHSPQLDPILDCFERVCRSINFTKPQIPVVSTLTGHVCKESGIFNGVYLAKQARYPVRFVEALSNLKADKKLVDHNTLWLEIGPKPVSSSFVRSTLDIPASKILASLKPGEPDYSILSVSLAQAYEAGIDIDWPEFHRGYLPSLSLLELPTYAFELKEYWEVYTPAVAQANGFGVNNNTTKPESESRVVLDTEKHCLRLRAQIPIGMAEEEGGSPASVDSGIGPPSASGSVHFNKDNEGTDGKILDAFLFGLMSETGFDASDIDDSTKFAEMGVDSLMGIAIINAVKKSTGVRLPASLFFETGTVGDMKRKIAPSVSYASYDISNGIDLLRPFYSPEQHQEEQRFEYSPHHKRGYSSNIVLLQGNQNSSKTPLFLICDGIGSAAAYTQIPVLPTGTPVYALESPFLYRPADFTCTLEEVSALYLAAAKGMQPTGPYLFGGWSAGAAYAYEVARQLLEAGDEVLGLLLIDLKVPRGPGWAGRTTSPCGHVQVTIEAVEQVNRLRQMSMRIREIRGHADGHSQSAKQHLLAAARCVAAYEPKPMDPRRRPRHGTVLIWARWGLCETAAGAGGVEDGLLDGALPGDCESRNVLHDNDLDWRAFFLAGRNALGVNGWDELVGHVEALAMDGDHFSIVRRPYVTKLGEIITKALVKFKAS